MRTEIRQYNVHTTVDQDGVVTSKGTVRTPYICARTKVPKVIIYNSQGKEAIAGLATVVAKAWHDADHSYIVYKDGNKLNCHPSNLAKREKATPKFDNSDTQPAVLTDEVIADLYIRCKNKYVHKFFCRTGSMDTAEDLYHDMFERVLKRKAKYDPRIGTGLFLITCYSAAAKDYFQLKSTFSEVLTTDQVGSEFDDDERTDEDFESTLDMVDHSLDMCSSLEVQQLIQAMYDEMALDEKPVFELMLEGYDRAEIATKLGWSNPYISKRIRTIRTKLEEFNGDC